jgi:hypothetical protein
VKPFGQRARRHKFLTAELRKKLPALYSQEDVADPLVVVKFFSPYSGAYWLITEFDGKDSMFGWAELGPGMGELGYVSLREIEEAVGGTGLLRGLPLVERDLYFNPVPLSEAKAREQKSRGWRNRKAGRRNAVTQLEGKTDALRRGMARTDLAWNPSLKRQLKQLLSQGEKMLSQFHHADLEHRLYGPSRGLQIPTTAAMDKLLTELSYAGLLFQPTGHTNRRGQRMVEEPKSPQEALILALMMAIEAPSEAESKEAVVIALTIMDRFGLSERDLQRAKASADMLIAVQSLQVEGKSIEDLMREGTLLTTPFAGPVGQANRNIDDVVIWLWTLAENPEEVIRLLKATPLKAQGAAGTLYAEIRKRHEGLTIPTGAPRNFESLQGLIYLNLFSSQIAPDPEESAFLFMRAAEVLSRAFEQNLTFTKEDLAGVVKGAMDSVRASVAMQDLVDSAPVGEANKRKPPPGALPHPAPRGGSGPVSCLWIPVSQPPNQPGSYLIFDPRNEGDPAWIGVYDLGKWWDEYGATSDRRGELEGITHWTPLPKDPRRNFRTFAAKDRGRSRRGARNTVTLIPAYGRDYKSKKAVLADWKAGKDFIIHSYGHRYDGKYINKQDADLGGETVSIRYAGRTKQLIIRPG